MSKVLIPCDPSGGHSGAEHECVCPQGARVARTANALFGG